jgi:glutamate dehydrogenase (NADP+)
MIEETERISIIAQELGCSMGTAAYVHALKRLAEAIEARGTRDDYLT